MSKDIKNTLKNGKVRFIIFKKGSNWYGVALEFNIVEVNKDPDIVLFDLLEAMTGYVQSAIKNNIHPSMLGQKTDKEYEKIWEQINKKNQKLIIPNVYMFGKKTLARV